MENQPEVTVIISNSGDAATIVITRNNPMDNFTIAAILKALADKLAIGEETDEQQTEPASS